VEIVKTLELPARISPCLRLFIETLFEKADLKHSASWHPSHEVQSAVPKAIQRGESLPNETKTTHNQPRHKSEIKNYSKGDTQ
jgi:hypothetical protein